MHARSARLYYNKLHKNNKCNYTLNLKIFLCGIILVERWNSFPVYFILGGLFESYPLRPLPLNFSGYAPVLFNIHYILMDYIAVPFLILFSLRARQTFATVPFNILLKFNPPMYQWLLKHHNLHNPKLKISLV